MKTSISNTSNFFDSPISILNSNSINKINHNQEEESKSDDYSNLKNMENSFEFEDHYKELKFDLFSTEESKNNSNRQNQNSISSIQNNFPNLEENIRNLNEDTIFENNKINQSNEEYLNFTNKGNLTFNKITKDQILESFFTCKICKKILYSPFICKTCGESACHSCFGRNSRNEVNNKIKKTENANFNICKICKNENVNIMPNFKVIQLKEDICKNYKNYPYLENSSIQLINKVKEYTSALFEYLALDELTNNGNENNENLIIKEERNVSGYIKMNNTDRNSNLNHFINPIIKSKNKSNYLAYCNSLLSNNYNNLNSGFPRSANMFMHKFCVNPNNTLYERYMDMEKLKISQNNNNQNFFLNNIKNNQINQNKNNIDCNNTINTISNLKNNGNSSIYNTTIFCNDTFKNNILMNAKFFIVRSIYIENLEISKNIGVWATTPFNENKLRDASKNNYVILLFTHSNNSLFYGCAILDSFKVKDKITEKFNNHTWRNDRGIRLGNLFKIVWLSDCEIPIYKLRVMNNPLNKNIPVLRSKDCQEVPYSIGSYIFKICESFSRKNKDEIDYNEISKKITKKRLKDE